MNKKKSKLDSDGTGIEPKQRKNTFYEDEYVRFGDEVIKNYLAKYPFGDSIDFGKWVPYF